MNVILSIRALDFTGKYKINSINAVNCFFFPSRVFITRWKQDIFDSNFKNIHGGNVTTIWIFYSEDQQIGKQALSLNISLHFANMLMNRKPKKSKVNWLTPWITGTASCHLVNWNVLIKIKCVCPFQSKKDKLHGHADNEWGIWLHRYWGKCVSSGWIWGEFGFAYFYF